MDVVSFACSLIENKHSIPLCKAEIILTSVVYIVRVVVIDHRLHSVVGCRM